MEQSEASSDSKAGVVVPASEMGVGEEAWESGRELVAFLEQPYTTKQAVEHLWWLHAGQALMLMRDLVMACAPESPLHVLQFPATASMAHRDRATERIPASQISEMIVTCRSVLQDQLTARFFTDRPSNARLVLCYMSKSLPIDAYLPKPWVNLAKTLYLQWLRTCLDLHLASERRQGGCSTPDAFKRPRSSGLFRHLGVDAGGGECGGDVGGPEHGLLQAEVASWANLDPATLDLHRHANGLVNEFALAYRTRDTHPGHFLLFRQAMPACQMYPTWCVCGVLAQGAWQVGWPGCYSFLVAWHLPWCQASIVPLR